MQVTLRKFTDSDRPLLAQWIADIHASQYMSRHEPKHSLHAWYVIQVEGEPVGTVWLEKEGPDEPEAILGILIGRNDSLGRGVGRSAIGLAVETAQAELSFRSVRLNVRKNNPRAIACYQHCGFRIVREDEGANQRGEWIQFYEMRFEL